MLRWCLKKELRKSADLQIAVAEHRGVHVSTARDEGLQMLPCVTSNEKTEESQAQEQFYPAIWVAESGE